MSGLYQKQVTIILVITGICVTICVLLYCLSITNDWTDLQAFYFSFAERRLLLREGRMVHKRGEFGHQVIASAGETTYYHVLPGAAVHNTVVMYNVPITPRLQCSVTRLLPGTGEHMVMGWAGYTFLTFEYTGFFTITCQKSKYLRQYLLTYKYL